MDEDSEEEENVLFAQEDGRRVMVNGAIPLVGRLSDNEEKNPEHDVLPTDTQNFVQRSSDEEDEEKENSPKQELKFHMVLKDYVGDFGWYQIMFVLHKCGSNLLGSMYTFMMVFVAAVPEHTCDLRDQIPERWNCTDEEIVETFIPKEQRRGETLPAQCEYYDMNAVVSLLESEVDHTESMQQCPMRNLSSTSLPSQSCDKWIYDKTFYTETITSDWNLVCSRLHLAAHSNSVYWVGVLLGFLLAGYLADRYGRKPMAVISYVVFLVTGIASSFSPNYVTFLVLRFLTSLFKTCAGVGASLAGLEIIGDEKRIGYFMLEHAAWASGYFVMDALAYNERRWRYMQAYIILPEIILFLAFTFYFKESPRWLVTQARISEAVDTMKLIAKRNGSKLPANITLAKEEEKVKVNAIELFRRPAMRTVTLVLFSVWFSMGLVYYGISLHTGLLGGNPFFTFAVSGSVDLVAGLFALFLYQRHGRIWTYTFGALLASIAFIASIFVPEELNWVIITTAMVGKFVTSIPGSGTWLYALEVYPTSIRSTGVHTCSVMARFGAICASYIGILAHINPALPLLVFGISSVITGIAFSIMPETKGEVLKQTVEEGERFMREKMFGSFPCYRRCRAKRTTDSTPINEAEEAALLESEDEF